MLKLLQFYTALHVKKVGAVFNKTIDWESDI